MAGVLGNLQGKTAVITGGASGIGLAMAQRFGAEGMNVVIATLLKRLQIFRMKSLVRCIFCATTLAWCIATSLGKLPLNRGSGC
jgi:hypothetical protein